PLILPSPPSSTLFPYTTLFRSVWLGAVLHVRGQVRSSPERRGEQGSGVLELRYGGHSASLWITSIAGARNVALLDLRLDADWDADRKSTRLNSSHDQISYAVFC